MNCPGDPITPTGHLSVHMLTEDLKTVFSRFLADYPESDPDGPTVCLTAADQALAQVERGLEQPVRGRC